MIKKNEFCECCGASLLDNIHSFGDASHNLLLVLIRCFEPYEAFHLRKNISLTNLQYTGLSKLQYWGLIEKHFVDGIRISGFWKLTDKAKAFVNGEPIPKWVKTFRGEIISCSTEMYDCSLEGFTLPPKWSK